MKLVLVGFGFLCLGAGFAGVFLPLLPTTPLVLLAAWCFARSSDRFHSWLVEHPLFGNVLRQWQEERRIDRPVALRGILLLWASIALSIYLMQNIALGLLLASFALLGTLMLWRWSR